MDDISQESLDTNDEEKTTESVDILTIEESEIPNESMLKDDSESSDSSGTFEEFDDVNRLVVKSLSKEQAFEEPVDVKIEVVPDAIENIVTPERDDEIEESTRDDVSSLKTESRDELESKEDALAAEEEALHKEEDRREKMKVLLTGYLEMKTKKEIEKALLNEKKIISQWLYPFRGAYQKEWELEMKKLKLGFQKALDYKKSHIHAIQRERKLVELNHLWADSAHYRVTEELFDFMRRRCEQLKNSYLEELEETKTYYLEREKEVVDNCTRAEDRAKVLALMRKNVHDKTMEKTRDTLDNFVLEGEFLKEKEMEMVREQHLTYVEMIANELQTSISPPEHRMDEIRAMFNQWRGKYQDFLEVSEKNRKQLKQLGEEIPLVEAKVEAAKKRLEHLKEQNRITKQKENDEVGKLKSIARRYETLGPSLRRMISSSEELMVKLRERKAKLDKIMKLKKICDQLEFESDAVFPDSRIKQLNQEDEDAMKGCTKILRRVCSKDIEDQNLLSNQHHKLSLVEMQNQYMVSEIKNLRVENMALRSDMKKYLHLITSGEWKRVSDVEFRALMSYGAMKEQVEQKEPSKDSELAKNLDMLDRLCRPVNDQIIKRIEKF